MSDYSCCDNAVRIDRLGAGREMELPPARLLEWAEKRLIGIQLPTRWKLRKSLAQILVEQTTLVNCEFMGDEELRDPVCCKFSEETNAMAPARVYPHVLFITIWNNERVVLGSLTSRTFYDRLNTRGFVSFGDLAERETTKLFDALYLFDEIDYFFLFDKEADTMPSQRELGEALIEKHCHVQCNVFPTEAPSELAPYAFQYALFAASASDRLSVQLIEYEVEWFRRRLALLELNPYLQFECIRKWLRVDWRAKRHDIYTHSNYPFLTEFATDIPAYHFAAAHLPEHIAYPTHIVPVNARYAGWAFPGNVCPFCPTAETNCLRPPIEEGTVHLPISTIWLPALSMLRMKMREWIQKCRSEYATYDAIRIWTNTPPGENIEKAVIEWTLQYANIEKFNPHRDAVMYSSVQDYVRRTVTIRNDFRLVTDRDFVILNDVIIPSIWRPLLEEQPDEYAAPWNDSKNHHPLWFSKRPKNHTRSTEPGRSELREVNEQFDTHAELVDYASRHWAPCWQAFIASCTGKEHPKHQKRILYARFLMNTRIGYTQATIRNFWFLAFEATDVFQKSLGGSPERFSKSKWGRALDYLLKKPFENSYWPSCRDMIDYDYCAFGSFGGSKAAVDIEEIVRDNQTQCTNQALAKLRNTLNLRSNRVSYRLFDPTEWTVNIDRY